MGFALPKLNWLSRGRTSGASRISRPLMRRADAHPDAPARAPIFASRDFGGLEIFPRIAPARGEQFESAQPEAVILPGAPTPAEAPDIHSAVDAAFEAMSVIATDPAPASLSNDIPPTPSLPSLAELTARFEKGLTDRVRGTRTAAADGVIADMPTEQRVPVRDRVEDDVDQALRAALGTLRAMADRTR